MDKKRPSDIRRILLIILFLNLAVALAKIIYGLLSRCASMSADGFHSLSDSASNIIGLIGITLASRPRDEDHPYGHQKYETFFSLGIGALLLFIAFNIFKGGLLRLSGNIVPRIDLISFMIMTATLGINLWVMRYEYKRGSILHSDILVSDATHTKADIFTSLAVIIALIVMKLGLPPAIDSITTLAISLFIAYAGYNILKQGSDILCDTSPIMDTKKITDIVLGVKGVKTCHKVRSRGRPDDVHIDLHVQVNPHMHIEEAHKISYAIEKTVKEQLPEITDVVVHLEPKEKTNPRNPST